MIKRGMIFAVLCVGMCSAYAQTAADDIWSEAAMIKSRHELRHTHGDHITTFVSGERLEHWFDSDDASTVWELQAWRGKDLKKFWFKTEGEYSHEENALEEFEVQFLYSRAISPFWDVQFGVRHDLDPNPTRTYLAVSLVGLAPYWFEMDMSAFISERGDLSLRVEAEYEARLTQRLILQPRVELSAALSDDIAIGQGAGLSDLNVGLRLRYEIRREFAPYMGLTWGRSFGKTRDLQQLANEDTNNLSLMAGVRFWF